MHAHHHPSRSLTRWAAELAVLRSIGRITPLTGGRKSLYICITGGLPLMRSGSGKSSLHRKKS